MILSFDRRSANYFAERFLFRLQNQKSASRQRLEPAVVAGVDSLVIDKDLLGVGDDFNREGEYRMILLMNIVDIYRCASGT